MLKAINIGNVIRLHAVMCGRLMRPSIGAVIAGILLWAMPCATQSHAQEWPQRIVRLILPFGAGSAADTIARIISEDLATRWGKAVVVENRPGADGLLAINAVVGAKDDHVMLLASTGSFLAHPYESSGRLHSPLAFPVLVCTTSSLAPNIGFGIMPRRGPAFPRMLLAARAAGQQGRRVARRAVQAGRDAPRRWCAAFGLKYLVDYSDALERGKACSISRCCTPDRCVRMTSSAWAALRSAIATAMRRWAAA